MSDRLFDIDEFPVVPLLREPRRVDAALGVTRDARFRNDYPPDWDRCQTCEGWGNARIAASDWPYPYDPAGAASGVSVVVRSRLPCPTCLGMGSLKARARLEAGHRCERCRHPYVPKGDAVRLSALGDPIGRVDAAPEDVGEGAALMLDSESGEIRRVVKPSWVEGGWSACDERCDHGGPVRWPLSDGSLFVDETDNPTGILDAFDVQRVIRKVQPVEAAWRILTVHHLDGDKANCQWWNLAVLCQRCHLEIQAKVVMERVYIHEHSEWFKPHAAGYYAFVYLDQELTREETVGRMDELLALELA